MDIFVIPSGEDPLKCGECMVACPPDYDAVVKISPPELAPIIERPEGNKIKNAK